jgi:sec-independent protein translocase protein TatB
MNGTILGIGPLEVLLIGILILLVFGPERLPEFARGLGKALHRLRETYVAFTQEFKDDLQPIAQDLDEVTRELRQEVQAIREAADIRAVLQPYTEDINRNLALSAPVTEASSPPALPPPNSQTAAPVISAAPPRPPAASIALPDDNPWASVGAVVRTDRLDDDNPWLSLGG